MQIYVLGKSRQNYKQEYSWTSIIRIWCSWEWIIEQMFCTIQSSADIKQTSDSEKKKHKTKSTDDMHKPDKQKQCSRALEVENIPSWQELKVLPLNMTNQHHIYAKVFYTLYPQYLQKEIAQSDILMWRLKRFCFLRPPFWIWEVNSWPAKCGLVFRVQNGDLFSVAKFSTHCFWLAIWTF